jgi:molybdopterin-guanine dinucleotide biosynthesis protein A
MKPLRVIHILCGGGSQRMGVDKASISMLGISMRDWCLSTAETLGAPVTCVTRDLREGQGPLAGIETGLCSSPAELHAFLSCDMPLLSAQTLRDLFRVSQASNGIACMEHQSRRGFPMIIPRGFLPFVQKELNFGRRSLFALFNHPGSRVFSWDRRDAMEGSNVNTPREFQSVSQWARDHDLSPPVRTRVGMLTAVEDSGS